MSSTTNADPSMSLEALSRRLDRLEAIDEIRKLKLAYATLCDDGYPGDKIGALFAQDAVFDGGPFGRYEGRDAIAGFYAATSEKMPWATHLMTNDVIEVAEDGATATGVWNLPTLVSLKGEDGTLQSMWILGVETDEYVRESDGWKFKKTTFTLNAAFDQRRGWHERLVQL